MELVECRGLCKEFGRKKVLDGVNITVPRGKIVGLLGKNGTGKSTLIKLINDLLTPTSGEIFINGLPVGVESKRVISYLPERIALDKRMSVNSVIEYYRDFYDNFDEDKARRLLSDLGLDPSQKLSKMSIDPEKLKDQPPELRSHLKEKRKKKKEKRMLRRFARNTNKK